MLEDGGNESGVPGWEGDELGPDKSKLSNWDEILRDKTFRFT